MLIKVLSLPGCNVYIIQQSGETTMVNKAPRYATDKEHEDEYFVALCYDEERDEIEQRVSKDPSLLWTAVDGCGYTMAHAFARQRCVAGLNYMLDEILKHVERMTDDSKCRKTTARDIFTDAFGKKNAAGCTPMHSISNIDIATFLLDHSPSGNLILEAKNLAGQTPIHTAVSRIPYIFNSESDIDFMFRHVHNHSKLLQERQYNGFRIRDLAKYTNNLYRDDQISPARRQRLARLTTYIENHTTSIPSTSWPPFSSPFSLCAANP
jgi:hypothetical protein